MRYAPTNKPRYDTLFAVATILFAFAISLWIQGPDLLDENTFHGDTRQVYYWMARTSDPGLFSNDMLATHSDELAPAALRILFTATSNKIAPLIVAKLLAFFLCPAFAFVFYKLCRRLQVLPGAAFIGTVCAVLILWSKSTTTFGVGDAEDFIPLLLAMFLYFWHSEKPIGTALTLIAQALLYPPAMLICWLALGLSYVHLKPSKIYASLKTSRTAIYTAAFAACTSIILLKFFTTGGYDPGALPTKAQMLLMPEFFEGGRAPMFYNSLFDQIINFRSGLSMDSGTWAAIVIFLLLFLFAPVAFAKKAKAKTGLFFLSCIFLFIAANAAMLHLFSPSRYMRVPLPLLLALGIAIGINHQLQKIAVSWKKVAVFVLLIFAALALWLPMAGNDYHQIESQALYQAILTLPKTAVIATHPYTADSIPIMSRRSVYVSDEMALPFFQGYYSKIADRLNKLFKAYYGSSPSGIREFCAREKVTHFLADRSRFTTDPANGRYYFLPYNDLILDLVAKADGNFGALSPPTDSIEYEDSRYLLYRCDFK